MNFETQGKLGKLVANEIMHLVIKVNYTFLKRNTLNKEILSLPLHRRQHSKWFFCSPALWAKNRTISFLKARYSRPQILPQHIAMLFQDIACKRIFLRTISILQRGKRFVSPLVWREETGGHLLTALDCYLPINHDRVTSRISLAKKPVLTVLQDLMLK